MIKTLKLMKRKVIISVALWFNISLVKISIEWINYYLILKLNKSFIQTFH